MRNDYSDSSGSRRSGGSWFQGSGARDAVVIQRGSDHSVPAVGLELSCGPEFCGGRPAEHGKNVWSSFIGGNNLRNGASLRVGSVNIQSGPENMHRVYCSRNFAIVSHSITWLLPKVQKSISNTTMKKILISHLNIIRLIAVINLLININIGDNFKAKSVSTNMTPLN